MPSLTTIGALLLATLAGAFYLHSENTKTFGPLSGVTNFEPSKYLGTWYEIAVIPYFWEYLCYGTKAVYTLKDPKTNTLGVANSCYVGSIHGELSTYYGEAY